MALATASATGQVRSHAQAHQLTADLRERVAGIVAHTNLEFDEAEQRKVLVQQIEADRYRLRHIDGCGSS